MKQLEEDYPVVLSQDVIWGDMDAFGHVNNTVYFRYFEDARIAYFDKIGVHEHKEKMHIGPILATTNCDFRLPLEYPDRVQIVTRGHILSPKKFNMYYGVYSERFGGMAAGKLHVSAAQFARAKRIRVARIRGGHADGGA